ncbi:helix-turn-helix domain-containing protein [Paracoccus fistulariae]|uniref:Helix-turn-helix transcriptional regulator n=1 Tax=Paracoccus fistulariae TaxID=658446 RepID=A0ABY7SIS3_9RHOB|nr:helix-turn-helix transcriptional regulator [Paracoccus fistulariae]MDB6182902.1 helix-turn-helix transcriptional regulator [Paracoccus fistulariae]WCR06899.1 helix-turn-helix transcriptional regulator [Paracoccus fistulariae]
MTNQGDDYESIAKNVGAGRLRKIREENGLSRQEFAERIDKSLSDYSNYESGRRELPLSTRLAVMDRIGQDPLPTEVLREALSSHVNSANAAPGKDPKNKPSWLSEVRAECKAYRENNFSRPARVLLAIQDRAFAIATVYGWVDTRRRDLGLPSIFDDQIADILLVASFLVVLMLIIPIFSEFPVTKFVRHLIGLGWSDNVSFLRKK